MAKVKHHKVVNALPIPLEADSIYYVRKGAGFEVVVTNALGAVVGYEANYQPKADNLTALAGLTGAANRLPYFTGAGALSLTTLTAVARTLLAAADTAGQHTALGLGTAAAANVVTDNFTAVSSQLLRVGSAGLLGSTYLSSDLPADVAGKGSHIVRLNTSTSGAPSENLTCLAMRPLANYMAAIAVSHTNGRVFSGYVNNAAAPVWSELFTNRNVLGTVSQSGGVPTGAIIEVGSNTSGTYMKLAGGLMVAFLNNSELLTASTAVGGVFVSDAITMPYPVSFPVAPKVYPAAERVGGSVAHWAQVRGAPTTTGVSMSMLAAVSGATGHIGAWVVGRWNT